MSAGPAARVKAVQYDDRWQFQAGGQLCRNCADELDVVEELRFEIGKTIADCMAGRC